MYIISASAGKTGQNATLIDDMADGDFIWMPKCCVVNVLFIWKCLLKVWERLISAPLFRAHNTYRILGTIQKSAYRLDASGVYSCVCVRVLCKFVQELAVSYTVFLYCLCDCGSVLWWDKPHQMVLDFTSCQVLPKCIFLQKCNFLSSHKLTSQTCRSQKQVSNLSSKIHQEKTPIIFNKDIFQGEMITCGLWFMLTICVRHRECVWVVCLWRIGMNRKSQRMFGHHQTDTEVWNERDRAGVKCVRVFVRELVEVALVQSPLSCSVD